MQQTLGKADGGKKSQQRNAQDPVSFKTNLAARRPNGPRRYQHCSGEKEGTGTWVLGPRRTPPRLRTQAGGRGRSYDTRLPPGPPGPEGNLHTAATPAASGSHCSHEEETTKEERKSVMQE